jgi:signal transduction histidine kinase
MFQNAIRHNVAKGTIFVKLTANYLRVKNTGKPLQTSASELFERFKKDNQSGETIGLGLAIMKKICDISNFEINYKAEDNTHTLDVRFSKD